MIGGSFCCLKKPVESLNSSLKVLKVSESLFIRCLIILLMKPANLMLKLECKNVINIPGFCFPVIRSVFDGFHQMFLFGGTVGAVNIIFRIIPG